MQRSAVSRRSLTAVLLVSALGLTAWPGRPRAQPAKAPPPELTGPFVHDNLAVFLIHDRQGRGDEDVVTLEDALKRGDVEVEETGQVNELVVSNKGTKTVFLQAGDVVKGGRQDRTLQHDALVPPRTRKMPLKAFCVESGRWRRRGSESPERFGSSSGTLVTRKQKLAAKAAGSQHEVWAAVAETQAKLGDKLGRSVKARASESSLQLSLEEGSVQNATEGYVRAIEAQLPARNDVVGYAFAVNGQVSAVDVYASPALFRKMRGKLLRASAVEAVAEKTAAPAPAVAPAAVEALIQEAESGAARTEVTGAHERPAPGDHGQRDVEGRGSCRGEAGRPQELSQQAAVTAAVATDRRAPPRRACPRSVLDRRLMSANLGDTPRR